MGLAGTDDTSTIVLSSSFFSTDFSIDFRCWIGAGIGGETTSFFFFSADFEPKHDAHKPPVDFLIFFVGMVGIVGNGPGVTNSISGKSTDAPCKSIVTDFFVTVLSSLFVTGITTGDFSGWTSTASIVAGRGSKSTWVLCSIIDSGGGDCDSSWTSALCSMIDVSDSTRVTVSSDWIGAISSSIVSDLDGIEAVSGVIGRSYSADGFA